MEVYYTNIRERKLMDVAPFINYLEPSSFAKNIMDMDVEETGGNFKLCPAVQDYCRNTFVLKFPMDYSLEFEPENNKINSSEYNQDYFDSMVQIRSVRHGMYTLRTSYVFFSEESVEIEMSGAHFSDSEFSSKVKLIPGTFDIGKWVRPLDCTFVTKPGVKTLNINRGDDWGYVKFNTKEKIRLKKFHSSDRFMDLMESNIRTRTFKRLFPAPLSYYYKLYEESKMHKLILKEVKNNLMD